MASSGIDDLVLLTDGRRHLICWPYSAANLHRMAEALGIGRWWFHGDHYDIPQRRRAEIEALCVAVPTRKIVEICRG